MASLKDDLQSTEAFPAPRPSHVEFIETHASWVFLTDEEVLKVKKPVNLGFLDFTTLERRKQACDQEVSLNRRLAPRAYLGVVPIMKSAKGFHAIHGEGVIVDWAVRMVRLPDSLRADHLVRAGKIGAPEIDRLGRYLAGFHANAQCNAEIIRFGEPKAVQANLLENFQQTRGFILNYLTPAESKVLRDWQLGFLQSHSKVFDERIQAGRIRDGHGDLRLQHVYLSEVGSPTILDCIEFNDRFRYADVCADLAFLSMDLRYQGRPELAETLLASYAQEANDFDLYAIVDFYESYRAFVRGKVTAFLEHDRETSLPRRFELHQEVRRYFLLALATCTPLNTHPALIVVGGGIASGKSTIADWLGAELGAPVVNSDRTRKHLLGVPPTQFIGDNQDPIAYSPEFSEKVYRELFRRAGVVLDSGRTAIIDGTFRSAEWRKQAVQLAQSHHAEFRFIECRAPAAVRQDRLRARESQVCVSDARIELLEPFEKGFEPVVEIPEKWHLRIDTSQDFHQIIQILRSFWPRGDLRARSKS